MHVPTQCLATCLALLIFALLYHNYNQPTRSTRGEAQRSSAIPRQGWKACQNLRVKNHIRILIPIEKNKCKETIECESCLRNNLNQVSAARVHCRYFHSNTFSECIRYL